MILDPAASARLASVVTAFPPHAVGSAESAAALQRLFPGEDPAFVEELVLRSGVERRHIALPLAETLGGRGFTERNAAWRTCALDLAGRAASGAIARAGIAPADVDVLID